VYSYLHPFDAVVLGLLPALMVAILLSGLDDLLVNAAWVWYWVKTRLEPKGRLFPPGYRQIQNAPKLKIAILVPLWQEHEVIGDMLQHNVASIRYRDYHIFAGCYPNDFRTQETVRSAAARLANVHVAVCPHDGPTSKGDCLNWIYQHLMIYEEHTGEHFDLILTHDAEDMIHPDELSWINYYAGRYGFIQTPVLAVATPLRKWTHGIYCDEFAENHTVDMVVRASSGGFVPGAGVGTGYRREALERLAKASAGRIFEPDSLTEDYVNGLRMYRLGARQAFVPLSLSGEGDRDWVVTRELFPDTWAAALRQRTRWVMGIALQSWGRFGWRAKPKELYWLWRDRKGLLGNPLSLISNVVFVYGALTGLWWRVPPLAARLAMAALAIQAIQTLIRIACTGRIYGLWFALGVPVRGMYANVLNSAATWNAVVRFVASKVNREPLEWMKTEHVYPNRAALLRHKRKLGEILTGSGYLTEPSLREGISTLPAGRRLGEHLVACGKLSMGDLYEALSLQQGLPLAQLEVNRVPLAVAQALPRDVVRELKVLPFQVADGTLYVAGPELPSAAVNSRLRGFTSLQVKFHLLTPYDFDRLARALL
jgi:bacteriophage N4 adsorption protein B